MVISKNNQNMENNRTDCYTCTCTCRKVAFLSYMVTFIDRFDSNIVNSTIFRKRIKVNGNNHTFTCTSTCACM